MSAALTTTESTRLAQLEATVERGLQTFVEVGQALHEIRDSKLYRAEHKTFDAYCQSRWGFSDRRARQLMAASEVGTIVPAENEGQARELLPLRDDEQAVVEAFRDAKSTAEEHGAALTAQVVRNAVRGRVQRIEREAEAEAARHAVQVCSDCGAESKATELGWVYTFKAGEALSLCMTCNGRRRREAEEQRRREWEALSTEQQETRRRERLEAEAEREVAGTLRFLVEGEMTLAEAIEEQTDSLRGISVPVQASALAAVAANLEAAAAELAEWARGADVDSTEGRGAA